MLLRNRGTGVLLAAATVAAESIQYPIQEKPITMATKKSTKRKTAAAKGTPTKSTAQKLSAINAAAKVLAESKEPLTTKQMIDQMATKGYWTSPGGKTPSASLYAAILRDIQRKGDDSRYQKAGRGLFTLNK